jgi:hypothetical protein
MPIDSPPSGQLPSGAADHDASAGPSVSIAYFTVA